MSKRQRTPPDPDARAWAQVLARDPAAEGAFVFAVRTTGIYCRPTCGARRPRRENVAFYADGASARAAGFRACRRCAPDAPLADRMQRTRLLATVCRWLDTAGSPPRLRDLAARAGYSPFHLQRVFQAEIGVSPRAYAQACRDERLRRELAAGCTVTAAMQRAGFGSTSRLHHATERALGMQPRRVRDGGAGERIGFVLVPCSLGQALVAATARGLCAILLADEAAGLEADLRRRFPRAQVQPGDEALRDRVREVVAYLDGAKVSPGLPLDLRGTVFQLRVWRELQRIPAGATSDYSTIATRLGMPRGARAVAKACGDNPVAVLVPCHRVVRKGGDLAGYRWGLERKRALLAREGARAAEP